MRELYSVKYGMSGYREVGRDVSLVELGSLSKSEVQI